jgi:hypothetical protein
VLSNLVWRAKYGPPGGGFLACEIYHKLLSGATREHLEESGRNRFELQTRINCKGEAADVL